MLLVGQARRQGGGHVNDQDNFGFSALHHAFFNKDLLTFAQLLAHGASAFGLTDALGTSVADLVKVDPSCGWHQLHRPMCELVHGADSVQCHSSPPDSTETQDDVGSTVDDVRKVPDGSHGWVRSGSGDDVTVGSSFPGIRRLDATVSTIVDVVRHVSRGEPVLIENALVRRIISCFRY